MTTSKPRQKKTARQRAEEAYGVAKCRVDALTKQRDRLQGELNVVAADLEEAQARLDYARKDPALNQGSTTSTRKQGETTA